MARDDDDFDLDEPEDLPDQAPDWAKRNRERSDKAVKARNEARAEADALRKENAFLKSGLNLDAKKTEALLKIHTGEITPEALRQTAVDYGWAEPAVDPNAGRQQAADESAEGQQQIADASNGAGQSPTGGTITPDAVSDWPVDKWARFMKQYPEATQQLLQGNEVSGIAFN